MAASGEKSRRDRDPLRDPISQIPDMFIVAEVSKIGFRDYPSRSVEQTKMPSEERRNVAPPPEAIAERTEQRLLKELRESETRYRTIVEQTSDWIWEMDLNGRHVYSNHQLERILGYSEDEFSELSLDQIIHSQDMLEVNARLPSLIAAKRGWHGWVVRFRHKDGGYRYLESNAQPILDAAGGICGFRGADRDITKRKNVEDRLRDSERRLEAAQRIAKIGNWDWDIAKKELWWSDEVYRIFGFDPGQFKPSFEGYLQTLHPKDRARVTAAVNRALNREEKYSIDFRIRLRDGTEKIVHSEGEVIFNQEGHATRMTGTAQDVTERAQLERDLFATKERERARIGRDLHDGLGQELTGISLRLQSLVRTLASERSSHVQAAEELTALLQNTIGETRRVARILAPGFSTELGFGVALRALAEEVTTYSEAICSVECPADFDVQDDQVAANLYRISQEAVHNAIRHSDARNIEVLLSHDGESVTMEILDDGIGIPPASNRVDGLGLKSMRYRARMIHGHLDVSPRTQGGTRIFCSCPDIVDSSVVAERAVP